MKTLLWSAGALWIGFLALISSGCAVSGGGYGYDAQYYQSYGYNYGGWGPQYTVAPVRVDVHDGDHHDEHGGGQQEHGGGRPVPSLPPPGHAGGEHDHH